MRRTSKVARKSFGEHLRSFERYLMEIFRALRRLLRYFLVILLSYLIQSCILPYVKIGGVTPSLLFAVTGIITVCYGRLRAYWTGGIFGIILEITKPPITYMNLLLYPIAAAFCSVFFADKSDKRLETERSLNKSAQNGNVYLRSALCAGMNTLLYEIVNITYIYLGGTELTLDHFIRGGVDILTTMVLALLVAPLVRRYLGFALMPTENRTVQGRYLA